MQFLALGFRFRVIVLGTCILQRADGEVEFLLQSYESFHTAHINSVMLKLYVLCYLGYN